MAKNLSLAVLLLLGLVKADQPVSCLGQAAGAWNFHMSADAQTVDLFQTQEVCTHQMPNKLQILTQNQDFSFASEQVMQVQLNEDGTAKAQKCGKFAGGECKASDGEEIAGTWVAFYDQAFKVELDNGQRFLANYRYSVKEYVISDPLKSGAKAIKNVETDDYDKFYSQCDRTMVGFVQDKGQSSTLKAHAVDCFYGIKADSEKSKLADQKAAKLADAKKKAEEDK